MKTTIKLILSLLIMFFTSVSSYSQQVALQQWTNGYNSPSNLSDIPNSMSVDSAGNMYITGESDSATLTSKPVTMKYNSAGTLQWSKNFIGALGYGYYDKGMAVASDNSGNCYTVASINSGNTYIKCILIKYDTNGDTLWTRTLADTTGTSNVIGGADIRTDNAGNIYAACLSIGIGHYSYIKVLKLTPDGQVSWQYTYAGPAGNHGCIPKKLILDGSGNVYIIGGISVLGSGSFYWFDALAIKLNNSGIQQWASTYDGAGHNNDEFLDISLDASGNVYTTGFGSPGTNQRGIIVAKYDGVTGGQQWVKTPIGTFVSTPFNTGYGIAVSQSGNIFVCGLMQNIVSGNGNQAFIIRLNSAGDEQWRKFYNHNQAEEFHAISFDNTGNLIATGMSTISGSQAAVITAKYNQTGDVLWNKEFSPGSYINSSFLQVLPNNSVYISGFTGTPVSDIFSLKYLEVTPQTMTYCKSTNKSIHDFQNAYDTINISGLSPTAVVVDVQFKVDTILHTFAHDLIGTLKGPSGLTDTLFKNPGKSQPSVSITGCNITDTASHLLDTSATAPFTGNYKPYKQLSAFSGNNPNGNWIFGVYDGAGGDTGTVNHYCITIAYYDPTPNGIQTISNGVPKSFMLSQNYPNPFNPTTNIKFTMPRSGNVSMKVYDILGREVAVLVNEFKQQGIYKVDFDGSKFASGVYFYKLESSDFTEVKKMVLVK